MSKTEIAEVVREVRASFVSEESFFESSIFYYMSGRYPDMAIKDCVYVVNQLRSEINLRGFEHGSNI